MFFKKRNLFALSLTGALLLAACGNGDNATDGNNAPSGDGNTDVVTLQFWDENAGPARTPLWEEIIENFNAENDDVQVEYLGLPKDDAKSKIDAAIAANDTPDLASLQTSWLPEFSVREALYPLDDFFADSELNSVINEGAIEFNKAIVNDGALYGVPYTQNLDILWVRDDLLEEAGVKEPETWEEFFTAIEDMTSDDMFGYTIRGGAGGSLQLQRLMYAYSGITEYVTEEGKATVNDPLHHEFVERYFNLYETNTPQGDITNGYKEMVAAFDTGKAAILHHNIGSFGEHSEALEPDQFKAIPLPVSIEGNYVAEGGNTIGISIFAGSDHPEEAFRFIEFANNAESQSIWNQEVGQIPTNSEVMSEEWIQDAQHLSTAFSVYDNTDTALYEPPFYLPDYRSILDNQVDPGIQSVMAGEKSVEDFLADWAEAIEASVEKYNAAFQ